MTGDLIGVNARRRAAEIVAARSGGEVWEWQPGQFIVRPRGVGASVQAANPLPTVAMIPTRAFDPASLPISSPFPSLLPAAPQIIPAAGDFPLAIPIPTPQMPSQSVEIRNEPLLNFLSDAEEIIPSQTEANPRTAPGAIGSGPGEAGREPGSRERKERKAPILTEKEKAISEGRAETVAARKAQALEKARAKGRILGADDPIFPTPRKKAQRKAPRRKKRKPSTTRPDVSQPLRRLLSPSVNE